MKVKNEQTAKPTRTWCLLITSEGFSQRLKGYQDFCGSLRLIIPSYHRTFLMFTLEHMWL